MSWILQEYNYWTVIVLMMVGFYILISRGNLVKKLLGLSLFQTSVFIMYISIGTVAGGTAPILLGGHGDAEHAEETDHGAAADDHDEDADDHDGEGEEEVLYSNPLPHVLILTAIVVGIATTAVGLSLVVRIKEVYGTIEEDEIHDMDESL